LTDEWSSNSPNNFASWQTARTHSHRKRTDGATIAARDFSGREPAEIANFAIVENSKGRDVFARLGGSLIKSSEGARMPFLGSVRYPYDGGAPELVGAPRPDPNLSKAHPLTSEPKSF